MTTSQLINVEKINENNWRQGDIFPQGAIEQIAEKYFPNVELDDLQIIVVSQSCDIHYYKNDEELWIEVLLTRSIPKQDNASVQGRRQRCYHFEMYDKISGTKSWFEANIDDRYKINRNFCADYKPSSQWIIHNDEIRSIAQWIAYRYTRLALPNAFNKRIRHKKNDLKKLLKRDASQFISGLYIHLSNEELSPEQIYKVKIIGTVPKQYYVDDIKRKLVENHVEEFEKILNGCEGIDTASRCLSEEKITLDDIKQLERFTDYDYLSYDSETDFNIIS
ncbi:MAG: hypothetical protein LBT09_06295 [Planctomycetaceae bacterium]|jgi:hypothetical protein|nr:hypothetical protein [Planctomycetaceae bacterium]